MVHGLPEAHRRQAAEVYYAAFGPKLGLLMGSADHGTSVIEKSLCPALILAAVQQERLVGLAGLVYDGRSFLVPRRSAFVSEYGLAGGLARWIVFRASSGRHATDGLTVEALAVAPTMRSQGIGTLLLQAVFDLAGARGLTTVSLDVVDTNPHARRLYERLGFVATRTRHYPWLRRVAGFSASTTMVKCLAP